jgi:hypothetical protein
MKTMKKIIALLLIILASYQVRSQTGSQSQAAPKEVKIKYRLVISFVSQASGIDGDKFEAIDKFIRGYHKKLLVDILPWGREGERDYCMHLKELSKSEQKKFIAEVKKIADGSDRVLFNENTERVKKQ